MTRTKKIIYITLAIIIALTATIYFGANTFIKNKLESKLGELVNTTDNKLYSYSLGDFSIELVTGTIKLSDISVTPTEFAFESVRNMDDDLRLIGDFSIEEVLFEEFEIKTFFKTGIIELKQFRILNPTFTIHHNILKHKADTNTVLSNTLSDKFISAALGKLSIENANLSIREINETAAEFQIEDINILLTESFVDSKTIKKPFPFEFNNITVTSSGLHMDVSKDYEIKSGAISFDVQSKSFEIDSFKLIPKHTHKEFEKINKYNVSEYKFDAEKLIIEGYNFEAFEYEGKIQISLVKLINNHLVLYNNKNKPFPPEKEKILWATALRKIPLTFTIDTLIMENSLINIHEKSTKTQRVSNLFFEDMDIMVTGISTDSNVTSKQNFMNIKLSTKLLGKGKAKVDMKIDLTSPQDDYWVSGSMGSMNALEFNKVLNPLFDVNVTDGNIKQVTFNYYANKYHSKGKMDIEYTDLKMELHSKKDTHKKNRFASLIVNTIIKGNNIKSKKNYKQGIISHERDNNKSSFNYLWKSLQSGIVTTLVPERILKKLDKEK